MPKLKNPSVKQLKKMLWRIVSPYIRKRDKGKCFTCGDIKPWKEMQAGHFVPADSCSDTQFDEKNVHCQCVRCNKFLSGNLMEYTLRMIDKYGKDCVDDLRKRGHKPKKWKKDELKDLIEYYKEKLANVK